MFKPVRKTRVYEEIVSKIKVLIEEGRLKSGDQLPPERELSEVFKVSRSSLREALRALESEGFLECRQGDGTYVARKPIEQLVKHLASAILTEKDAQLELFEIRRLIEPQLAFLAAERATPGDLLRLEEILDKQSEEINRGENAVDIDKDFHYALAEATKNKTVLKVMDNLMDAIEESRDRSLQVEGRPEKSLSYHRDVLNALKARNRELAAKAMREHLEDIESILFAVRKEVQDPSRKTRKKGGSKASHM
jgi:GntR family transcriptional repressor for pyruvate dehydrogenase complex